MTKYYTLVTDVGRAKMANAQVIGEKVSFSQIALGSSETKPRENQTALGKEEWRGPISNVSLDKDNPNWIVVEAVVPSNVGGFEIAEVGVYDEEGHLIVVGNHPKTYKPKMDEGTTKDVAIRIVIEVSNAEIVELKVDPSVVIATREYVESAIELAMASIDFSTIEKQIDQHVSNADIHVTAQDKKNWNAKETPSAAQAKATKALKDAKAYTDKQIDDIPKVDISHLETKKEANKKLEEMKSYADIHSDRTDNPHKVTKSQIGLGNVANYKIATETQAMAGTSNTAYMTPLRTSQYVTEISGESAAGVLAELNKHKGDNDNPHNVTKVQVGLGNVDNVKQATKKEFAEHKKDALKHINNKNNPHNVTADQVTTISSRASDVGVEGYPIGVTAFYINDKDAGYPSSLGTVLTIKAMRNTAFQYFSRNGYHTSDGKVQKGIWYRAGHSLTGWAEWEQSLNEDDAKEMQNTINNLTKKVDNLKQATKKEFDEAVKTVNDRIDQLDSGNITVIPPKRSNVGFESYPLGVTVFYKTDVDEGYPHRLGTVMTTKDSDRTCFQLFARNGFNEPSQHIWYRIGHYQTGWTDWFKIADERDLERIEDSIKNISKSSLGLGNVDNVKQASKSEFDSHVSNGSNPHKVTKSQVGLGNVDNIKQATKSEFNNHVSSKSTGNSHGHVTLSDSVTSSSSSGDGVASTPLAVRTINDRLNNLDSQDITVINRLPGNSPAKDYPIGITTFYNSVDDEDYPYRYGNVTTIKSSSVTALQFFSRNGFYDSYNALLYRMGHRDRDEWTEWRRIAHQGDIDEVKELAEEALTLGVKQKQATADSLTSIGASLPTNPTWSRLQDEIANADYIREAKVTLSAGQTKIPLDFYPTRVSGIGGGSKGKYFVIYRRHLLHKEIIGYIYDVNDSAMQYAYVKAEGMSIVVTGLDLKPKTIPVNLDLNISGVAKK